MERASQMLVVRCKGSRVAREERKTGTFEHKTEDIPGENAVI